MSLANINNHWDFSSEIKTRLSDPLLQTLFTVPVDKKIARIKEIRAATGMNLMEAKKVLDEVNHLIPSFTQTEERALTWERTLQTEDDQVCTLKHALRKAGHEAGVMTGQIKTLEAEMDSMEDKFNKVRVLMGLMEDSKDPEEQKVLNSTILFYLNI